MLTSSSRVLGRRSLQQLTGRFALVAPGRSMPAASAPASAGRGLFMQRPMQHHQHPARLSSAAQASAFAWSAAPAQPSRSFFSAAALNEARFNEPPKIASLLAVDDMAALPKDHADALVVFLSSAEVKEARKGSLPESLNQVFAEHGVDVNNASTKAAFADFSGDKGSTVTLYTPPTAHHRRLVLTGLGKREALTVQQLRDTVSAAVKACKSLPSATLHLQSLALSTDAPKKQTFAAARSTEGLAPKDARALTELVSRTAVLSTYDFADKYKGKATKNKKAAEEDKPDTDLKRIAVLSPDPQTLSGELLKQAAQEAIAVIEGTILAREIVNLRADVGNPDYLEATARRIAEESNGAVSVRVVDYETLKAEGYSMITAVGQASEFPPRMLVLEYKNLPEGVAKDSKPLALVGKGLCFDTGGLDLKPSMKDMWMDKGGAAAVLGVMKALSGIRPVAHVVTVAAVAENSISEKAYRPFSIIPAAHGGPTVEVGNTDAEGRLCLVDAFTWVQKHHPPKQLVDVATLTGACIVALGDQQAGLFSNSAALVDGLTESSLTTGERVWHLPIAPQHEAAIKGTHSDLLSCQVKSTSGGGSSSAAAFLQAFIDEGVEWAHLDVAGPAMDGSGFGVQLLVDFIKRQQPHQ